MPELPEVEVIRSKLEELVGGKKLLTMSVQTPKLRYAIDTIDLINHPQARLNAISRHAKYMVWHFDHESYLLHLGMSGRVRICEPSEPWEKHEHIQWHFENTALRLIDPRRFGCWVQKTAHWTHKLEQYGPDPLHNWNIETWFKKHQHNKRGIYKILMDQHCLSGIGNIYAQEALFESRIHPKRTLNTLSLTQLVELSHIIQSTLKKAITSGGTTLNDYRQLDGSEGYFQVTLKVYGKAGTPCPACQSTLLSEKISQRTVAYCMHCQGEEGSG